MDFSTLAHAKLNLDFDHSLFAKEYDERILPNGIPICNGLVSIVHTEKLNEKWGMVDPALYNTGDYFEQTGDHTTMRYVKRDRPQWQMVQLMDLDRSNVTDPLLQRVASAGGPSVRNETLDSQFNFAIKSQFADLQIWNWINSNLPFNKINSVHCVSLEPGGLSTIHRDMKGLYDNGSSAGINKVYKNGYVVICINITNGGGPLYWALDGKEVANCRKADDPVYLTNDYFMHGVPICTSRRRQVRVTGIPKPELWDLIDPDSVVDIGHNYRFDARWPTPGIHFDL